MRILVLAICWAAAILLLALAARLGWLDRAAADLLLMVTPMIALVTLLGRRNCRSIARAA
ncbi:MAG: hypothetical protein ABI617_00120 [Sphingomicrobium sp.]